MQAAGEGGYGPIYEWWDFPTYGTTKFFGELPVSGPNPACRNAIAGYETQSAVLPVSQRVILSHFFADFFVRRFRDFRAARMPRSILLHAACVYSVSQGIAD